MEDDDFVIPEMDTVSEYDDPSYGEEYTDEEYCEDDYDWG